MIPRQLTPNLRPATSPAMQGIKGKQAGSGRRAVRAGLMLVAGAMALSGCVSVQAPDKPIVIELNINIKQDVIYRLADDAAKTIEQNSEVF